MGDPAPAVRRTRAPTAATPQCEQPFVLQTQANGYPLPSWFEQRAAKLVRRGYDPARCGKSSSWEVDGPHYCAVHGGLAALAILESRGSAARTAEDDE